MWWALLAGGLTISVLGAETLVKEFQAPGPGRPEPPPSG